MSSPYAQILILAAVSDGEIQKEELDLIRSYLKNLKQLSQMTEEEFQEAAADVYNKINAGVESEYIIKKIGEQLDEEGKEVAYALAYEVCMSNYAYIDAEKNYIKTIEETWCISNDTSMAIKKSCRLRYGID